MKVITKADKNFILKLETGESFMTVVPEFLEAQKIGAAVFSAVGAVSTVELGYFNPHLKDYRKKLYTDEMEIVSLTGNVAMLDQKPSIHMHGSFGHTDFSLIGGHIFKLVVGATCEVFLQVLDGEMQRALDPSTNLNLLI